jgi:hypothetical protein
MKNLFSSFAQFKIPNAKWFKESLNFEWFNFSQRMIYLEARDGTNINFDFFM